MLVDYGQMFTLKMNLEQRGSKTRQWAAHSTSVDAGTVARVENRAILKTDGIKKNIIFCKHVRLFCYISVKIVYKVDPRSVVKYVSKNRNSLNLVEL